MESHLSKKNMQDIIGKRLRIALAVAAALCAVTFGNRSVEYTDVPIPIAQPGSLIAVADLHGDVDKAIQALQLLSIVDQHGRWIARQVTVVQLGDLVDRGPSSLDVIKYMHNLQDQAVQHQSQLVLLLGNHELMNLNGDFRYVAPEELVKIGRQQQQQRSAADTALSSHSMSAEDHPLPPAAAAAAAAYDAHITTAAAYSAGLEIWAALWSKAAVQHEVQQAVQQPLKQQIAVQEAAVQQALQQPLEQQTAVQKTAVQQAVQQSAGTQVAAAEEVRQAVQQQDAQPAVQQQLQERQLAGSSDLAPPAAAAAAEAAVAPRAAQPAAAATSHQAGSVRSSIATRHQLIAVRGTGHCRTAFVHAGLMPRVLQGLLLLSSSRIASEHLPTALRLEHHQHSQVHDGRFSSQLAAAALQTASSSSAAAAATVQGGSSITSRNDGSALVGIVTAEELQAINAIMQQALSSCEGHTCSNGPIVLQQAMALLSSADGPIWTRQQAQGHESSVCGHLQQVLQQLEVQRLVLGHTPQASGRATVRCGGRLLLLDTGMSSGMMDSTAAAWICQAGSSSSGNDAGSGTTSIADSHSSRGGSMNDSLSDSTAGLQEQHTSAWNSVVVYADGRVRAV